MVVVVVAVSKASSGRAWQSSSSYLSLYSLLRKKEFVLVSFFGVFLVNFFWREIFFSFFFVLFSSKTQQPTRSILDRHTHYKKKLPLPKFMRVCLRVSVV